MKLRIHKVLTKNRIIKFIEEVIRKYRLTAFTNDEILIHITKDLFSELSPKFLTEYFITTDVYGIYKHEYKHFYIILFNKDLTSYVKILIKERNKSKIITTIKVGMISVFFKVLCISNGNIIVNLEYDKLSGDRLE